MQFYCCEWSAFVHHLCPPPKILKDKLRMSCKGCARCSEALHFFHFFISFISPRALTPLFGLSYLYHCSYTKNIFSLSSRSRNYKCKSHHLPKSPFHEQTHKITDSKKPEGDRWQGKATALRGLPHWLPETPRACALRILCIIRDIWEDMEKAD